MVTFKKQKKNKSDLKNKKTKTQACRNMLWEMRPQLFHV